MTFDELRSANATRVHRWHDEDSIPWNIAEWTNALCGEAGEAANVAKKIRRVETRARGRDNERDVDELRRKLGDELADVVIYADLCAHELGLSLAECVAVKFNRTSVEYGFPERLREPA